MTIEMLVQPGQVFRATAGEKGDGGLIALKIALQALKPDIVVVAPGSLAVSAACLPVPAYVTARPLAAARMLARLRLNRKSGVLVVAGDLSTIAQFRATHPVAEKLTYLCINNAGSSSLGFRKPVERPVSVPAAYAATASIAFPEDYMRKLLRAKDMNGMSLIDVHAPSPSLWGYEPANTIEVSHTAVLTGVWPLVETVNKKPAATFRPDVREPVERYIALQHRFSDKDRALLLETVEKNRQMLG